MSNKLFFFDSETSGLPVWGKPSGDDCQPHIVQLAALVVDADTRKVENMMDVIIKPDGWVIPQEVIDIHGITNDHADELGVPEERALSTFFGLWAGAKRVAHGTTFDNRIIRIAAKRFRQDSVDPWKAGEYECTGQLAKKVMGISSRRIPKLSEAYSHFFGKEPEVSHQALPDAKSCMEIYWAIKDLNNK